MRNSHEAMRSSIKLMTQWINSTSASDIKAFEKEWNTYKRVLEVHMGMEDRFMFTLLETFAPDSTKPLISEHEGDTKQVEAIDGALSRVLEGSEEDGVKESLKEAFLAWKKSHLEHLEHEEKILMPITMKAGPTPAARSLVVHERLVTPTAQAYGDKFDWYIGWCVKMLNEYGSTGQPPNVAVRVFAWGLQHASNVEQWKVWGPIVQAQCSESIWQEMVTQFQIDQPGKISGTSSTDSSSESGREIAESREK